MGEKNATVRARETRVDIKEYETFLGIRVGDTARFLQGDHTVIVTVTVLTVGHWSSPHLVRPTQTPGADNTQQHWCRLPSVTFQSLSAEKVENYLRDLVNINNSVIKQIWMWVGRGRV